MLSGMAPLAMEARGVAEVTASAVETAKKEE